MIVEPPGIGPGGKQKRTETKMNDTAPKNNIQDNKPKPTLLPIDVLIKYLCPAYEEGLIKYERESWRRGFQVSILVDAAIRHISDFYYRGEDWDRDAEKVGVKKHHLAGAIFSLLSILHTLDTRPELDDRFSGRTANQNERRT